MGFAWPVALVLLAAVPVLAAAYLWSLRRRRRQALAYSSLALIRAAGPPRSRWRRHAPAALVLASLACLGLAAARPQLSTEVPVSSSAVVVALDVSGSMCSTDVAPNRLTAAQAAVHRFLDTQDESTRIGLVVFSGFAQIAVAPTGDRKRLQDAVDALTVGRGTTIGAAILKSVDAIAQVNPAVAPAGTPSDSGSGTAPSPRSTPSAPAAPVPEIVILLTDGANTRGISPQDAAAQAAQRGVRVYPIGFGTREPAPMVCSRQQLGGTYFEGQGRGLSGLSGGGARSFLVVDEDTLRTVATTTGGTYFAARDADQLQTVLADLPRQVRLVSQDVEITVVFAALGMSLLVSAGWAASRWSSFPA